MNSEFSLQMLGRARLKIPDAIQQDSTLTGVGRMYTGLSNSGLPHFQDIMAHCT